MPLPPRPFYSPFEVATRWECDVADIIDWAVAGHLHILVLIPPCTIGGRIFSDVVEVAPSDIHLLLRRFDRSSGKVRIMRLRYPGEPEWTVAVEGEEGLMTGQLDLLIAADDIAAFEGLYVGSARGGSSGTSGKYDWDGCMAAMLIHARDYGLPANQAELIGVMQEWFVAHSPRGEAPDESTIRKRLNPIWQRIRDAA